MVFVHWRENIYCYLIRKYWDKKAKEQRFYLSKGSFPEIYLTTTYVLKIIKNKKLKKINVKQLKNKIIVNHPQLKKSKIDWEKLMKNIIQHKNKEISQLQKEKKRIKSYKFINKNNIKILYFLENKYICSEQD